MSEVINIKECEALYIDEWLLFEVVECDEKNHPVKGRLIAHSKDRGEIHRVDMQTRCPKAYITYTGEPIPKDMAVAL